MISSLKKYVSSNLRHYGPKYLHHYLWPARLHSRMVNFNDLYETESSATIKNANIGAGPYFKKKTWVSIDFLPEYVNERSENFIHYDLANNPEVLPIKNMENIYTSHTIEHFDIQVSKKIINACYKSLRKGGIFRIVVPDADFILDAVKENRLNSFWYLQGYTGKKFKLSKEDWAFQFLKQNYARLHRKGKENQYFDKSVYREFSKRLKTSSNSAICNWLNTLSSHQNEYGDFHLSSYTSKIMINILKEIGFSEVYLSGFMKSKSLKMQEVPLFDGTHPWLSLYVEAKK